MTAASIFPKHKTENILVLFFCGLLLIVSSAHAQTNYTGKFDGEFSFGNYSTRILLDIDQTPALTSIQFSSPEQNAYGIPAQEIQITEESISFNLQSDFYKYQFTGQLLNQTELSLVLTVEENSFPFILYKQESQTSKNSPSFVDIKVKSDNLFLYGTLYRPSSPNGKAIYLVSSSGNNDRSASRSEAEYLAQKGYVTLHMDKRGTGISDGNWRKATIPELCEDDINAIKFLSNSENINYANIGIKGSSQGASKVPYILLKLPELGFGIAVSCPGSTLLESDLNYWKNRNKDVLSAAELEAASELQKTVFEYIGGSVTKEFLKSKIALNKKNPWFSKVWIPELDRVEFDPKLSYSPIPFIEKVNQPLLVIQGSADEIIPEESMSLIQELSKSNNSNNEYVWLDSADHSMMFKGESDFPYWSSLHSQYYPTVLKWISSLDLN